jgi:DNA adenine methylase
MKPFLKWAGGKRWLVSRHPELFEVPMKRYIEPFLGSGAVFFDLEPENAIISDQNSALTNVYDCFRSRWWEVDARLRVHARKHSEQYYYRVRNANFENRYDQAAQLLYLNRTCWNGLYRENLRGQFNVPKGTKDQVLFPDDDFQGLGRLLKRAEISCSDFEHQINRAKPGDFVFVDPPYTVKHNNNGFLKYNETIFSWIDQVRLANAVRRRSECGANFLITNAFHQSLIDLYREFAQIFRMNRASVISGSTSGRGRTDEAVIAVGPHWHRFDWSSYSVHDCARENQESYRTV